MPPHQRLLSKLLAEAWLSLGVKGSFEDALALPFLYWSTLWGGKKKGHIAGSVLFFL